MNPAIAFVSAFVATFFVLTLLSIIEEAVK